MMDVIIKGGVVVTQNEKREIVDIDIGIKDGLIVKLGEHLSNTKSVIRAESYIITPAYLNGHIHFGEYYLRGYKERLGTEEYISAGEKFCRFFDEELEAIRTSSIDNVMCESIKNGTLTFFGMRGWPRVQRFGVNAFLGYPLMNSEKLAGYLKDFEKQFDSLKQEKDTEYFLGLHSLKWLSERELEAVRIFMQSHPDVKLSLHICETKKEIKYITDKYNMSPICLMDKFDLLNEKALLVHCNYLSEEDRELIKRSGASVAVCHSSNLKLGNVPCDVKALLEKGINVMAATDGPATSDSLSLLDAIRVTALVSGAAVQDLYDMITVNPAKYMGINTGSIQAGNKADLMLYDRNDLCFTYRNSVLENLVYLPGCRPAKILKSGKVIVDNYRYTDNVEVPVLQEKNRIISLIEGKVGMHKR